MKETEEKPVLRENFGPGRAGELAYQGILSGLPCAAFIDSERTRACGKLSNRTVDFDFSGYGDYLPSCGLEHSTLIKNTISRDLARQGYTTSFFGENGFGRA